MQLFPGMTPADVWSLPFAEWVILAAAADRWATETKRRQAQQRRQSRPRRR
jgi:hypothetical protein